MTVGRYKDGRMFISHFNRMFARHGRLAFLIIGIVIVFPFVFLWGSSGQSMQRQDPDQKIGEMYGRKIAPKAFFAHLYATEISVYLESAAYGRPIVLSQDTRWRDIWVRESLKRMRALREAESRGLDRVSDAEVADAIRQVPVFQKDGQFDRETFRMFSDNFLRSRGVDGVRFDAIMRENLAVKRLESSVTAGAFVAEEEVREAFSRSGEKFAASRCALNYFEVMKEAETVPSDAQVQEYFTAHREELRLPDQKRVRVAELDPATFTAKVGAVTPDEIQAQYERTKARYEKDKKTLDDVRAEIEKQIQSQKAQKEARALLDDIRAKVLAARESQPAKPLADAFGTTCKDVSVDVRDSGPFGEGGEFAPFGARPMLQRAAYGLTDKDPLSGVVGDAGKLCLVCWLETIPGGVPTELNDASRKLVVDRLLDAEANAFYDEKVGKFRAELSSGKTPDDLKKDYAAKLAATADQTDEQKELARKEFEDEITAYLVPYFMSEQRKVRVAVFAPDEHRASVQVTDEGLRAYHERNRREFMREEVRLRQITLPIAANATPEQKAELKAKLDSLRQQVAEGADFAELAKAQSSDVATKEKGGDTGFLARGAKPKPYEEAAFGLEVGEISQPVDAGTEYVLLKAEEQRLERPFEEIRAEVEAKMIEAETSRLAQQAATRFADRVFTAFDQKPAGRTAADLFAELAAEAKVVTKDSGWFRGDRGGMVPSVGYDEELAKQAHKLRDSRPVSDVIKGKKDYYVACWQETKAAYLPQFATEEGLARRVRSHVVRDHALKLVRERAKATFEAVQAKLQAGEPFEKAIGDAKFEDIPEFTQGQPSARGADSKLIADAVAKSPAGTLLPPIETNTGALLVYLKARTPPTDEEFAKERQTVAERLRREKEGVLLNAFHKKLEDASKTVLAEAWQERRRG